MKTPDGLDKIWPNIRAEIKTAKRKEAIKHVAFVVFKTAAVFVIIFISVTAVYFKTVKKGPAFTDKKNTWQVEDIYSGPGTSSDYPLVHNDRVYALSSAADKQRVICVDKHQGQLIWESELNVKNCRLGLDDNHVFVIDMQGRGNWICASLDSQTGKTLWQSTFEQVGNKTPSDPMILDNKICWTQGRQIHVFNADTGESIWNRKLGSKTLSAPIEQNGTIFAASGSKLYALNSNNGESVWEKSYGKDSWYISKPFLHVDDQKILISRNLSTSKNSLICMNANDGAVSWRQEIPTPMSIQVANNKVFVRSGDVRALDMRNGSMLWATSVGGCSPLSFKDDLVYVTDNPEKQQVVVLNESTGANIKTYSLAGSCNGFIISGQMAFISAKDILHAVVLEN